MISADRHRRVEPVRGAARVLRASLVSLVVVSVSLVCHTAAGGMRPSGGTVAVVATVTALASVWLTRWRLSAPRLTVLMLLVEALTHVLCSQMGPVHGMSVGVTPAMAVAHLVAAGLSVAYLRSGEDVLWSMLRSWATWVARPLTLEQPHPKRSAPLLVTTLPLTGRLGFACSGIRGPPA